MWEEPGAVAESLGEQPPPVRTGEALSGVLGTAAPDASQSGAVITVPAVGETISKQKLSVDPKVCA